MPQKINEKELSTLHKPVLFKELTNSVKICDDRQNIIVDCTLGMGGHAIGVLKKMNRGDVFVGFDVDKRNLSIVEDLIKEKFEDSGIKIILINDNFVNLRKRLLENEITEITGIYYDLGISSLHVDEATRGFSFKLDGPLDMRFDENNLLTAKKIVNSYKKKELADIFFKYGEIRNSRKIAGEILKKRKKGFRFNTTKDLSDLIDKISFNKKIKTKVFQALRIEVNKEFDVTEKSVSDAIGLLNKGGNIFVISFHSLEDRIIKNIFKKESKDCICGEVICVCKHKKKLKILTKKPIIPSDDEIRINKRSRSAKARLAEKI